MEKTFYPSQQAKLFTLLRYLGYGGLAVIAAMIAAWFLGFLFDYSMSSTEYPIFVSIFALLFLPGVFYFYWQEKLFLNSLTLSLSPSGGKLRFSSIRGKEAVRIYQQIPIHVKVSGDGKPLGVNIHGELASYRLEDFEHFIALWMKIQGQIHDINQIEKHVQRINLKIAWILPAFFLSLFLYLVNSGTSQLNLFLFWGCFVGCFLLVHKPIVQFFSPKLKLVELFLGCIGVGAFTTHLLLLNLDATNLADTRGCGSRSPLRICYSVTPRMCQVALKKATLACQRKTSSSKKKSYGINMGASRKKKDCIKREYNKQLKYNRLPSNDPSCF